MDLHQMRFFLQVYEDRNISRAASHLYVSQQYLSRIIKRLEAELDCPLFVRTPKGLIPTKQGDLACHCFAEMLKSYHGLEEALQESRAETLSGDIRVVLDIELVKILTPEPSFLFSEKYPKVKLGLEEHRIFNCKRLVRSGEATIGLSICDGWSEPFRYIRVLPVRMVVLVHSAHPLAKKTFLTIDDLIGQPLILAGCPPYYTILQEFEQAHATPDMPVSINDDATMLSYIRRNKGIAPYVYGANQSDLTLPKDVVSIPYQPISDTAVYAYWDGETEDDTLPRTFANYLKTYFER